MGAGALDGAWAAVIGALSGGVVSYGVTALGSRKQARLTYYASVESHLDELQVQGVAYWRSAGLVPNSEAVLISRLEMLDLAVEAFCRVKKCDLTSHAKRIDEISELTTGGSFQTSNRRRDMARIGGLRKAIQSLKDELFKSI